MRFLNQFASLLSIWLVISTYYIIYINVTSDELYEIIYKLYSFDGYYCVVKGKRTSWRKRGLHYLKHSWTLVWFITKKAIQSPNLVSVLLCFNFPQSGLVLQIWFLPRDFNFSYDVDYLSFEMMFNFLFHTDDSGLETMLAFIEKIQSIPPDVLNNTSTS